MAFVYEVERPPLFPINKDTSEIGPGQYLPLTLYKFEKPNTVPFNISTKRQFPFSFNPVPGPGSYNAKEEQNIANPKLIKEQEAKDNNKNQSESTQLIKNKFKIIKKKNIESEKFQNKENLGFFTKVQRFKLKTQINTPGPGTYDDKNILLAKSIEEKCNNQKEIIFKINNDRHNIFYVNRKNNQFPWNAEVIDPKKKTKNKIVNNYKKFLTKNENIIINNKSSTNNINSIITSNKPKNKKDKKSGKNRESTQKSNDNKMNLTDSNINNNDKNKNNNKDTESNKNSSSTVTLKKSKTSSNFYLPDTGVKIQYSKLSKKEIKQKLEEEMNLRKIQNDIKYRICSIPSKFCSGYNIEKDTGKIVRNPIKTKFKIFSGEKNDAVGPGSYEINLPELWRKTGTCWSKYLCEKEPLKKRPNSGKDYNENKLIHNTKLDKYYKKIVKNKINNEENENENKNNIPNFYKIYTTQQILFKDKSVQKINAFNQEIKKDKLPVFIYVNDVPGPGYYYDEEKNINNNIKNNKNNYANIKKINHHENFLKNDSNDKEGLGPGTYFNDILNLDNNQNNIKKILSKKKNKSAPFLCKSKRFIYDKSLILHDNNNQNIKKYSNLDNNIKKLISNDNSVESSQTSNSTHKFGFSKKDVIDSEQQTKNKIIKVKSKSMSGTFYRKDMRFRENYLEENRKKDIPGPGSYINPYTSTGKSNSVKIDDRYMDIRSCRLIIEKNRFNKFNKTKNNNKKNKNLIFWLGETNEVKPCVGTYEPDKTMTILYDINNNKKYGNNSFNSTQYSNRNGFYMFQRNLPNGPGCYYKDKFIENKQISAAFHSTADRFYKGGKNNTRDFHKMPKRSLSVIIKKFNNNSNIKMEDRNKSNQISVGLKERIIKEKKIVDLGMLNNSNTPDIVGPGTYNFLSEVYPWVKQSYNVKFI